jgi:hypothetical protein
LSSETDSNPRLAAALAYAARGWPVFPCLPRLKVPATQNGWIDASTDPDKLRAWWRVNPNYNVAIATGPANLFVVDVDPKGRDAWVEMLESDPDLRALVGQSATVETPRGGVHVYMEGPGPTSASKLAPGIDTRGERGYVLATPSYVDDGKSKGHYSGTPHTGTLLHAYRPFLDKLAKPIVERVAPVIPDAEKVWDAPETITRATAWLEGLARNGDVAVEGAGGDQRTYEVCCKLLEMAITPEKAHSLLVELWNPHCAPPWDSAELLDKIRNAWKYGQETKGGKAERPLESEFAHLLTDDAPEITPEMAEVHEAQKARYKVKTYGEAMTNRKPLEWIIPDFLPRKGIGILFGQPETLKTFLLLDLALSIATGYGPNWWEGEREPQQVLFLAGESPDALLTKRVPAWLAMHLSPHLYPLVRDNLLVVEGVPPLEMFDHYTGILGEIRGRGFKPVLAVVDTLTRAMAGKDENSAKDATWTTMKLEWLSRELNAFVIAIHHSGKDVTRGARGSSVWLGNTDFMLEAERPSPSQLSILVHLRKLKEGGKTDLPLKFDGAIHGEAPALTRDWDFAPVTELPASVKHDTEEWIQPEALAEILAKGPLTTEHLRDSLAIRFGVEKRIIGKKLHDVKRGRYKAWVPEGDIWRIPATHPAAIKEEEF